MGWKLEGGKEDRKGVGKKGERESVRKGSLE